MREHETASSLLITQQLFSHQMVKFFSSKYNCSLSQCGISNQLLTLLASITLKLASKASVGV